MTVIPGNGQGFDGPADTRLMNPGRDVNAGLGRAYLATYHGPHGDAPEADTAVTAPVDR